MAVQKTPDALAAHFFESELKCGVLERGVMAGLKDALGNAA